MEVARLLDMDDEADQIYFDVDDPDARHDNSGLGGFTVETDYQVPKAEKE